MVVGKMALSVDEMAQALGISRTVAYDLVKRADFPSVRLSEKRIVIPVDALREWLKKNMKGRDVAI